MVMALTLSRPPELTLMPATLGLGSPAPLLIQSAVTVPECRPSPEMVSAAPGAGAGGSGAGNGERAAVDDVGGGVPVDEHGIGDGDGRGKGCTDVDGTILADGKGSHVVELHAGGDGGGGAAEDVHGAGVKDAGGSGHASVLPLTTSVTSEARPLSAAELTLRVTVVPTSVAVLGLRMTTSLAAGALLAAALPWAQVAVDQVTFATPERRLMMRRPPSPLPMTKALWAAGRCG